MCATNLVVMVIFDVQAIKKSCMSFFVQKNAKSLFEGGRCASILYGGIEVSDMAQQYTTYIVTAGK